MYLEILDATQVDIQILEVLEPSFSSRSSKPAKEGSGAQDMKKVDGQSKSIAPKM
jgi:hypothetical protein